MTTIDPTTVADWLDRMAGEIAASVGPHLQQLRVVGIHSGGVRVAEALCQRLGLAGPVYSLDTSFYRDDFDRVGFHNRVERSRLPVEVDDHDILLVDDVLYTGRSVRAALNELFDYGRPARVLLAVLVERSGRELPIRPDFVGTYWPLDTAERVRLHPHDLGLQVTTSEHGGGR